MKKERIRKKAEELFSMYGVRSVTMDEISMQMGISKKTLYQSFNDKSDLVDEVVKDMLKNNTVSCRECQSSAENAVDELFKAMQVVEQIMENMNPAILFDLERGYPKSFKRFHDFKYEFLYGMVVKNLRWGKEDGLYRNDVNEEIFARARLEMITVAFNEQIFPKSKFSLEQIQKELMELFLYSVVTKKGYKLIEKYSKQTPAKQTNPKQ